VDSQATISKTSQHFPTGGFGSVGSVDLARVFRPKVATSNTSQRPSKKRPWKCVKTSIDTTISNFQDFPPSTRGCRRRAKLRTARRGDPRRAYADATPRLVVTNDERTTRRLDLTDDDGPAGMTTADLTVATTRARRDAGSRNCTDNARDPLHAGALRARACANRRHVHEATTTRTAAREASTLTPSLRYAPMTLRSPPVRFFAPSATTLAETRNRAPRTRQRP